MVVLEDSQVLQAVCLAQKKWGIMAQFAFIESVDSRTWRDEIFRATKGLIDPHLDDHFWVANAIALHNDTATIYLVFDTEEEMHDAFYNRIYGDDNSDTHGYTGNLHTIRCLTCNPDGELENENS